MLNWLRNLWTREAVTPQEQGFVSTPNGIKYVGDWDNVLFPGGGRGPVRVDHVSVMGLPAFKRAAELICNPIASAKCRVHRETPDGSRELAKDHPYYRTLRYAWNLYTPACDGFQQWFWDAVWNGNGYAYRDDKYQLWNISPFELTPSIVHFPTHKTIVYLLENQAGKTVLDASQVLHIKGLGHSCGLMGESLIRVAAEALGVSQASQTYASQFFQFGAVNDCWIEIPDGVPFDEEQAAEWQKTLAEHYYGIKKKRKPVILTGGAKLNKTEQNNDDAQFIQSRQFSLVDVANLVGIVNSKIGGSTNTSYNSLLADNESVYRDSLKYRVVQAEQQLWLKLLTGPEQKDYYIEFDRQDLTAGDAKSELELDVMKVQNGLMTWPEWRKKYNLSTTLAPEDVLILPSNYTIHRGGLEPPAPPPAPPPPQLAASADDPAQELAQPETREIVRAALDRLIERTRRDVQHRGPDGLADRHLHIFREALPGHEQWAATFLAGLHAELSAVLPEQHESCFARINTAELVEEIWKV